MWVTPHLPAQLVAVLGWGEGGDCRPADTVTIQPPSWLDTPPSRRLFINIDSGYVISPDSQQDNLGLGAQHVTGSVGNKPKLRYLHPLEPGHSRPLIETSLVPSTDNYYWPPDTKERKTRNGQNVFFPRDSHHLLLSSGQT